jgi:hypothetical protein
MWRLHFFMVIKKKKFTWSWKSKENLVCQLKRVYMDLSRYHVNGKWSLIPSWLIMDSEGLILIIVGLWRDLNLMMVAHHITLVCWRYVDCEKISKLKAEIKKFLTMKDLGLTKYILCMYICRDQNEHKVVAITRKIYQEGVRAISYGKVKVSCYSTL